MSDDKYGTRKSGVKFISVLLRHGPALSMAMASDCPQIQWIVVEEAGVKG